MTDLGVIEENSKYMWKDLWGDDDEIEKSATLLPDENIEFKGRGVVFAGKSPHQGTGFVILTDRRIIFLMFHFFGPAKLLYIPLNDISKINFKTLGLMRSAQKSVCLEYDKTSIIFAISPEQKYVLGLSDPTKTLNFYMLLKEKLPHCILDKEVISAKAWDYYLSLVGLPIGLIIGAMIAGNIGALVMMAIFGVIGNIIGKMINKFTK